MEFPEERWMETMWRLYLKLLRRPLLMPAKEKDPHCWNAPLIDGKVIRFLPRKRFDPKWKSRIGKSEILSCVYARPCLKQRLQLKLWNVWNQRWRMRLPPPSV